MARCYIRTLFITISLLAASYPVIAQEQDVRLSVEPGTGNIEQRWPGVIIQNGQLRVRWGELRKAADTNNKTPELWYVLGHWAGRNEQGGMLVVKAFKPDVLQADPGAGKMILAPTGFEQPREFDGGVISGSIQWRGDVTTGPTGTDTTYKSNYSMYVLNRDTWKKTVIYETKGQTLVTLRNRAYGYDPVRGEFITAWVTGRDTMGRVTAVDTNGTLLWNFENIPLPVARYHIIPIHDREFILLQDSIGTRYVNGVASGTMKFPMKLGERFQRIEADRFTRSYVGPDTAHYTLEVYNLAGELAHSVQVLRPGASDQPSHFVTTNKEEHSIALVMAGPDGVYATVFDSSLVEHMSVRQISRGNDSAFSPSAVFYGDTLYVAWQDNRNTIADIYGRAYSTGTVVVGVDPEESLASSMAVGSIAPNPAVSSVNVQIDMAAAGNLRLDLVDPIGRTVRTLEDVTLPEGRSMLRIDVADLPPGTYSVLARGARSTATARFVVVR